MVWLLSSKQSALWTPQYALGSALLQATGQGKVGQHAAPRQKNLASESCVMQEREANMYSM